VEPLVYKHLKLEQGKSYFFTGLTNRFDHANDAFKKALDDFFGCDFEPIYIFQNMPAKHYLKENFIVVNNKLIGKDPFKDIVGLKCEELNHDLNRSKEFRKITKKILKSQDKIFLLLFTTSFLKLEQEEIIPIGPKPEIANFYDNKLTQFQLFESLGFDHTNYRFYTELQKIEEMETLPFYITSPFTSGGLESRAIFNFNEMHSFIKGWREFSKSQIIVTDYIDGADYFPHVTAIVYGENKVRVLGLIDQVLEGNSYVGNVYPSEVPVEIQEKIKKMILKVGRAISQKGFRGLFGCDVMVKGSRILFHDLNPRREGSYGMFQLMIGEKLAVSELLISLGIEKCLVSEKDFAKDFCWGHAKVKTPCIKPLKIKGEFKMGTISDPLINIGSDFAASFYPSNFLGYNAEPAYFFTTDHTREAVISSLKKNQKKYIKKLYDNGSKRPKKSDSLLTAKLMDLNLSLSQDLSTAKSDTLAN